MYDIHIYLYHTLNINHTYICELKLMNKDIAIFVLNCINSK